MVSEYQYDSASPTWLNEYLWPPLRKILSSNLKIISSNLQPQSRIIDVGCGSGATAGMLADLGYEVVGIDSSPTGIGYASSAYPKVKFSERSVYDNLVGEFGVFDCVVSLEVVEHCYAPRKFAETVFQLLHPGGFAVISTPYHGYLKNLALALAGKFDDHWSPLWDGGHIKFWSVHTLSSLLREAGFQDLCYYRIGRIPPLAKSLVVMAQMPFLNF